MSLRFGMLLGGVTLLTLAAIFGFYRLFLYKPSVQVRRIQESTTMAQASPEALPSIDTSSDKASSPAPSFSPAPGQKATAVPIKSTIGSLSIIQNNTSGLSSSGGSSISGSINMAGTPPAGTSVVIAARTAGSSDNYAIVVSGIPATTGSSWSWSGAEYGKSYDLVAILKGNSNGVNTDYATSQNYVITAPALNQIFSINAATAPSEPTGVATITCGAKAANNTWSANVNFPSVSGAAFYKMQVGSASGDDDIANVSQAAQSGNDQSINVTINDSVLYYTQYSIANTANPTAAQYSAFSTPSTVKCPN